MYMYIYIYEQLIINMGYIYRRFTRRPVLITTKLLLIKKQKTWLKRNTPVLEFDVFL